MTSVLDVDVSYRLRAAAVLARVRVERRARVVDVGCATGAFAAELAAAGATVDCVDAEQRNLDALERLYAPLVASRALVPVLADATSLPFDDESRDAVFCLEVLEHVEDDAAAAAELARVLRRGGRCAVTVPNRDAPPPLLDRLPLGGVHEEEGVERHVRPGYSAAELERLLTVAGLRVDEVTGVGGRLYRGVQGAVSLGHLAYRRARGARSWTWADVEADADTRTLRAFARVFPALYPVARLDASRPPWSTLVVVATKR